MGITVDERDVRFVLFEQLKVEELLKYEAFKDFDLDTFNMILSEAQKFSDTVLYPANIEGDKIGCKFDKGVVTVPQCYKEAYDKYCEGGWIGVAAKPEVGGQGLPGCIGLATGEFGVAGSIAFTMYPGLTRSAAHLIDTFGEDWMRKQCCPRMNSGEWSGTMCLTEPQAGSAVGDIKTSAKKEGDHWLITGSKIFISSGEHDLTKQIIHLVLARTEGAPPGIKGISLFLVPKYRFDKNTGELGEFNDVRCSGIEHKMGIKASATCSLNFGDDNKCWGWMIGKEFEGIKYMFLMMNEARIGTGLQGQAAGSAAYLHALRYAKERIQGVDYKAIKDPNAPRVTIINHPDVRRMLMTMKAYTEAGRALLYYASWCHDRAENDPDPKVREKYQDFLELLTPVCKAWCSDRGFDVTRLAIQTYGGYGYCSEYPVEQYMRDCKIASIYEGTNGIQALDLIGRKVLNIKKQMAPYNNWIAEMKSGAEKAKAHPKLKDVAEQVLKYIDMLDGITKHFAGAGLKGDQDTPVLGATPYLEAFGDVTGAAFLLWQATIAQEKLDKGVESEADKKYYLGKVLTARFYAYNLLPNVERWAVVLKSGDKTALEMPEDCF